MQNVYRITVHNLQGFETGLQSARSKLPASEAPQASTEAGNFAKLSLEDSLSL